MERPTFQRRALFGLEPDDVQRAISGYERAVSRLTADLDAEREQRRTVELELGGVRAELDALRRATAADRPAPLVFREPPRLRRAAIGGVRRRDVRALEELHEEQVGAALDQLEHATLQLDAATLELDTWRERQDQLEALALRAAEDAERIEREARETATMLVADARREASDIVASARRDAQRQYEDLAPQIELRRTTLRRLVRHQEVLVGGIRRASSTFEELLDALPTEVPAAEGATGPAAATASAQTAAPIATTPTFEPEAEPADRASSPLRRVATITDVPDFAQLARIVRRLADHPAVTDVFVQRFEGSVAELAIHVSDEEAIDDVLEDVDELRGGSTMSTDELRAGVLRLRLIDER